MQSAHNRGRARLRARFRNRLGFESLESRSLLSAGPLGINVHFDFVDAIKEAEGWQAAPNSSTFTQDANGWPTSDATVLVADDRVNQPWNGPDPNAVAPDISGTYHLSFRGQATVAPLSWDPLFTVQNQSYNAATNTTTADLVVSPGYEMFYIAFTNTQNPASATGAGITNVQLIKPGYAANTTQLFTNNLLNAIKPFSALRYLDVDGANSYPLATGSTAYQVDWSQRRLPTDYSQTSSWNGKVGESWEYMIALANATNTDMWINVPGPASDDYVKQLATLIKNGDTVGGVTYAGLKPNLKVYLEYSNEVWGGIYNPYQYNNAAAADEVQAGGSALNNDGSTNPAVWANRRYLQRTMQITNIFRSVFGADPTYATIRPVLGGQEGIYGLQEFMATFPWFESTYGLPKAFFYGMGNANYWGPTDYSSVDAAISSLSASEAGTYATTQAYTAIDAYYGLKNVAYEGGPSIGGDGTTAAGQNALAASRDPRMEALVEQHYLDWYAAGGDLANYYSGIYGIWSPQNEWSAAEAYQAANPSLAAKYRGLVDVAAASPPAVTAGQAVASAGPTTFSATTDTLGDNFTSPSTGQDAYWLLRASASGISDLTMATTATGSSGQVQVFLNDQQVGGTITVQPSSSVDLGKLALVAGFNTVRIHVLQAGWQPTTFTLMPTASGASAAYVGSDPTTEGSWKGVYGSDGVEIANDLIAPPAYATATVSGANAFTWNGSTADTRALQKGSPQATDRIASCWYGSQFTIDVNLTDGQTHAVSLYALDWDTTNRVERIDVIDPSTGATLDTRSISSFQNGDYLTWNLKGHVQFRVTSTAGQNAVISGLFFGYAPSSSSAAYVGSDPTTEGSWKGVYGSDGVNIANDLMATPAYATATESGANLYTWNGSTSDVRALQKGAPQATDRIASCWYGSQFTIDVNLTDGQAHAVSLYALDWDTTSRVERIDVIDPSTGTVLDTRTISSFQNGEYLTWNLKGHVQFRVTSIAGINAVISGLFFGYTPSTNSATYVRSDLTTEGSWKGAYGSDGVNIANDLVATPAYATATESGANLFTWTGSTSDVRALQKGAPQATDRIASCWYGSQFTIDVNLTDGQAHAVSLYALDWDTTSRVERIDVIDPSTGTVLDTRTISSFQNGDYLTWNLKGHVQFRVTSTAGLNAVVSGLFFEPKV